MTTDEARAALWDWRDMTTDPPDGFGERLDALIAAVRAEEGARYRCDFECRECDSAAGSVAESKLAALREAAAEAIPWLSNLADSLEAQVPDAATVRRIVAALAATPAEDER